MIYNIVLNSTLRVAGSTTSTAAYYFDWTTLKEGKYKLTFTFVSRTCNLAALPTIPTVSVDLGQAGVFRPDLTAVSAASSRVIGVLVPNVLAAASFLAADLATNPPIFLAHKPSMNNFTVRILTDAAAPVDWTDNAAAVMPEYTLMLSLESV